MQLVLICQAVDKARVSGIYTVLAHARVRLTARGLQRMAIKTHISDRFLWAWLHR